MLGRRSSALPWAAWYVIARDGGLVLRIGPGLQVGRDSSGEPSFEAADARLELHVDDDGTLALTAGPEWAFEAPPGSEPVTRLDVPRHAWARLQLDEVIFDLNTDFGGERSDEPWLIGCVARAGEAHGPGPRAAGAESAALGFAPAGSLIAVIAEAAEPLDPEAEPGAESAPGQREGRRRPRPGRHGWLLAQLGSIAIGAALVGAVLYVGNRVASSRPMPVREQPLAGAPVVPATPPMKPEALDALADVSAIVGSEKLHSEFSWLLALGSAKALVEAYPEDPRPLQSLEQLVGRLADEAVARHDRGEVALSKRLLDEAAAAGVRRGEVSRASTYVMTTPPGSRAPAPPVEAVMVPPIARRTPPPVPAPVARPKEQQVPPQEISPALLAELTAIGDEARRMAAKLSAERDLRAAALALRRGQLMIPAEQSAFALYTRSLRSRPESPEARRGLQAVGEALLDRARGELGRGDLEAVLVSLEAATAAGADRRLIDDLRAEAGFQRRLANARAGTFDRLIHLEELVAVRQDPPRYPRRGPFGAQASVDLELTVTETGAVQDLKVLGDPPSYFADAATRAVSQWQFEPMMERGRPIPVRTAVRVTFRRN